MTEHINLKQCDGKLSRSFSKFVLSDFSLSVGYDSRHIVSIVSNCGKRHARRKDGSSCIESIERLEQRVAVRPTPSSCQVDEGRKVTSSAEKADESSQV